MNQIHPEPLSGTLVDILEETAARYPEHGIFHVASGDTSEEFQSYPELLRNAKEMAQVLYRRGLRPRTPLILSVDASRTFLEIFWGCLFSGVLPAPLAHMRTPKADSMEAQKIFHVWEAIKAPIVADSSNERAFAVLTDMFKGTGATLIASEDLITEARIVDFQENDRYTPQHDDSAVLQFSSGSTGMPKGARLTHRNLIANIRALRAIEGGTSEDRLVTCRTSMISACSDATLCPCSRAWIRSRWTRSSSPSARSCGWKKSTSTGRPSPPPPIPALSIFPHT